MQGDTEPAASLFASVATRHRSPEASIGLATAAYLLGDLARSRTALADVLRSAAPTAAIRTLAARIAPREGWCALSTDGVLLASRPPTAVRADTIVLELDWARGRTRLPAGWRHWRTLEVEGPAGPMLGSPLLPNDLAGLQGFVAADDGGLEGWAWSPAAPDRAPTIEVTGPLTSRTIEAKAFADPVSHLRPLARPRRFALSAADVAKLGTPVALRGPNGRHLLGSPIDTTLALTPIHADTIGPPPPAPRTPRAVDVVIPVYGDVAATLACLHSVLATVPRGTGVIVVDDASPEPAIVAELDRLARRRRITLIRHPENRGFPAAANAGLDAAAGRDAVLLNSDTLVPPRWLERLRAAAYSQPGIGTVTPLTNNGTLVSAPDPDGERNPVPNLAATVAADALAQRANGDATAPLPVGVGFCLYIRRDCLDAAGPLRDDVFAQGYGEENDLCLRARHRGWTHVAALGVFVGHIAAASFGTARAHLVRRNAAILERLHPGYDAMVARYVAADPLAPARRRMDALRWEAGRQAAGAIVFITHENGGGVERVVAARAAATPLRPVVLRPHRTPAGQVAVRVEQPGGDPFPALVYRMPEELPQLVALLRPDKVARVELHHLLGHHEAIAELAARLRTEAVSVVHDYARFCPRITLVSTERRYCGEPDVDGCEACIADLGSLLEDDPPVRDLRARSARELAAAARVIVPSQDVAIRIRRHFPATTPVVEPWEDDAAHPPLAPAPPGPVRRVVVVGAIGVEKGFEVLLGCARDARRRALPLEFVVVGFTGDDERLMAGGPVFVTGEYAEADVVTLIRAQSAHLALIPSVWPETWCLALTRAWQAGLAAAVFDLGAPAERVRRTGRGWILPLGLTPPALNDALLRLASARPLSQCPPPVFAAT